MRIAPSVQAVVEQVAPDFALHEHAEIRAISQYLTLGFNIEEMVKTLAFAKENGELILVALRATEGVNYAAVADASGVSRAKLASATEQQLAQVLGMEGGGVSPFASQAGLLVLVDVGATILKRVLCGSGVRVSTLEVTGAQLARIPGARVGSYGKAKAA